MADPTPSYDELLRDNIALRLKLAELETRIDRARQTDRQSSPYLHRAKQAGASDEAVVYDGGVYTVVRDMAERKRAEEALRKSHAFIRQIIDTDPNFVFAKDREGRFTLVNQAVADCYGTTVEGLLGKTEADFNANQDEVAFFRQKDREVFESLKELFIPEETITDASGSVRWLQTVKRPLFDEQGRATHVLAVATDITQRKLAEARVRSFTHELEARVAERTGELVNLHERLRALTMDLNLTEQRERQRLANDLHDYLAQLLALVRMKLGQIKRLAPPPAQAEIVRDAEAVVNEALTYTRTLVTQLSPPVLHEFGLPAALKWLAEQMVRQELSVEVQDSAPDRLCLPEDQAVLLFQSVRELLINVRKHAGTHRAQVAIEYQAGELRITVRDQGIGVDLGLIGTSGPPSSTSSKFGLFSIRERMLAIGGRLGVESSPGQGLAARLILPLSNSVNVSTSSDFLQQANARQQPVRSLAQASNSKDLEHETKRIRVLLVDDHPMVREGVKGLLQEHDDVVIVGEAWDGEEAVAFVDKLRPDCVIMDVNMPKIDGIEATRRIKAAFGQTAVVGISVNTSRELEAAMRGAGADEFLSKGAPADVVYKAIADSAEKYMPQRIKAQASS